MYLKFFSYFWWFGFSICMPKTKHLVNFLLLFMLWDVSTWEVLIYMFKFLDI